MAEWGIARKCRSVTLLGVVVESHVMRSREGEGVWRVAAWRGPRGMRVERGFGVGGGAKMGGEDVLCEVLSFFEDGAGVGLVEVSSAGCLRLLSEFGVAMDSDCVSFLLILSRGVVSALAQISLWSCCLRLGGILSCKGPASATADCVREE